MDKRMKHALGNISRQVGRDISSIYYQVNATDIINNYNVIREELGYPLMKDSKNRRVIVYNKKGIEKEIETIITNILLKELNDIVLLLVNDISYNMSDIISPIINYGKPKQIRTNVSDIVIKQITNGIIKGVEEVIESIIIDE